MINYNENFGFYGLRTIIMMLALLIVWGLIYWITNGDYKKLEKVLKFSVTLPVVLLIILMVRAVTLDGAGIGISHYLSIKENTLMQVSTWREASTQILMSLSIGMGQLIVYASRTTKKSVVQNGVITVASNAFVSLLAGFVVFCSIGFFVTQQSVSWESVPGGPPLVFESYPAIILQMPGLILGIGFIFFLMLFFLGIDSAFAVIEANMQPIIEKSKLDRKTISMTLCGIGFLLSTPYVIKGGTSWIYSIDGVVVNYGVPLAVLFECIYFAHLNSLNDFREQITTSTIVFGAWKMVIKYLAPMFLVYMLILRIQSDFIETIGSESFLTNVVSFGVVMVAMGTGAVLIKKYVQKGEMSSASTGDFR
ncbi:hypothetical protein IMSAGC004_03310 [Bacteroidaceae bacterium]|nr:hypothetical protein IMSAGC004_03310 [Bacteroidaceae bacterium]